MSQRSKQFYKNVKPQFVSKSFRDKLRLERVLVKLRTLLYAEMGLKSQLFLIFYLNLDLCFKINAEANFTALSSWN